MGLLPGWSNLGQVRTLTRPAFATGFSRSNAALRWPLQGVGKS